LIELFQIKRVSYFVGGKMKKLYMTFFLVFLLCFTLSCQKGEEMPEEPVVDVEAETEAVRKADSAWQKSVQEENIDKVLSFYLDDAIWFWPDTPTFKGKEGIKKWWLTWFNIPDSKVSWEPMKVEVSSSGDLAYSAGTFEYSLTDGEGQTVTHKGEYVAVWKKAPDGNWKITTEIEN
jgi:ketosteroid isomerase-like protein